MFAKLVFSVTILHLLWLIESTSGPNQGGLSETETLYHYVVLREDLPVGIQIAQTIHAAGESSSLHNPTQNTRAVALAVPDEKSLILVEQELAAAGIQFSAIREPDYPYSGALMAIGLAPQPKTQKLRQILGRLSLVR